MAALLAEMREMRAELRRQAKPEVVSPTVRELYKPYAASKSSRRSWPATEVCLRRILEWFGDRPAMSLKVADAEEYRVALRKVKCPKGKGRTYGDQTINFDLQWLKCMLTWAVRGGLIPHNPLQAMKSAKCKKHRKTSPTEDEILRMLGAADTYMSAFILFAADSGMRRNEILFMEWSWIDEARGVVRLPAEATKSQKDRTVPVTSRTFAALGAMTRHLKSPYPFANLDTGLPYSEGWIAARFRDITDAAGVKAAPGDGRVHVHDLRHSFARRAARDGVRVEVISMILGHASLQQTMVYLQTGEDDIDDARDTIERARRKPPQKTRRGDDVGDGRIISAEKKST